MEKYKKIERLLMKYSNLGYKEVEYDDGTGAKLIGERLFHGKKLPLNIIYNPISYNEIKVVEDAICINLPKSIQNFLNTFSNGLSIMGNELEIFGKKHILSRECLRWQPMDFSVGNIDERPKGAPVDAVFIGYYGYDCSNIFMLPNGKVHYCARWDATTLHIWSSFEEFLISEIERIYELYNDKGELIVPDYPTSPMHLLDL